MIPSFVIWPVLLPSFYLSSSGQFLLLLLYASTSTGSLWFEIRLRMGKVGGSLGFTTGWRVGLDCLYVADIACIVVRRWLIVMILSDFILGLVTLLEFILGFVTNNSLNYSWFLIKLNAKIIKNSSFFYSWIRHYLRNIICANVFICFGSS